MTPDDLSMALDEEDFYRKVAQYPFVVMLPGDNTFYGCDTLQEAEGLIQCDRSWRKLEAQNHDT